MKESIKKIKSAYGIDEYRLENGLRVLFKRDTSTPVVAVCVTFHVGSRNEALGHTGSTHILEHLLFKDSKNFNRANDKAITGHLEWMGAYVNATTWLDRTNYFELLPKEKLNEALALEADRMRNSQFSEADLQSEMTVVRNEYERGRNNPFELLDEAVMAKAFAKHPYRINTIGTKDDIESSSAEKLREFYNTFYWPNNATLMVAGDASWPVVEKAVHKYFGSIPSSPHTIPQMKIKEPKQTTAKSLVLKEPLGVSIAELAYKVPEGTHKDFPGLYVSAMILGGGFSSRMQKALVDTGLAADVGVFSMPLHDPGVLTLTAHVADKVKPQTALHEMRKVVEKFAKAGPTATELALAKERILSDIASQRDGAFSEVRAVSEAIAAGDWTLGFKLEKDVATMTTAHVARTAKKYLTKNNETSGILVNEASA